MHAVALAVASIVFLSAFIVVREKLHERSRTTYESRATTFPYMEGTLMTAPQYPERRVEPISANSGVERFIRRREIKAFRFCPWRTKEFHETLYILGSNSMVRRAVENVTTKRCYYYDE